jgi:aminoglycoside phosphotransferase (APT) family kinase protein
MHDDEVDVDATLVRRLVSSQFPEWADLAIERFDSAGTDNAIFRLGQDMAVRLPRIPSAAQKVEKEYRWLPMLAPLLPLAIPEPIAKGSPGEGYPWRWSVYRWLEGEPSAVGGTVDPRRAAIELARFVAALQRIDAAEGPTPGEHNSFRGVPLALRDGRTRAAIAALDDSIDRPTASAAWDTALGAPEWQGPAVWLHGDLQAANLLIYNGKLSAVIDFGCLGVGDPACDLMAAWTCVPADLRDVFRAELAVDDATWLRGRGWALSFGLIALPYYENTHPVLAGIARQTIEEILADANPSTD